MGVGFKQPHFTLRSVFLLGFCSSSGGAVGDTPVPCRATPSFSFLLFFTVLGDSKPMFEHVFILN